MSDDIALLKALIARDEAALRDLDNQFAPTPLMGAALIKALVRRLGRHPAAPAVIHLVAHARASVAGGFEVPPAGAEALICGLLGIDLPGVREVLTALSMDELIEIQLTLLTALFADEQFSDRQLDEFLEESQAYSDELIAQATGASGT